MLEELDKNLKKLEAQREEIPNVGETELTEVYDSEKEKLFKEWGGGERKRASEEFAKNYELDYSNPLTIEKALKGAWSHEYFEGPRRAKEVTKNFTDLKERIESVNYLSDFNKGKIVDDFVDDFFTTILNISTVSGLTVGSDVRRLNKIISKHEARVKNLEDYDATLDEFSKYSVLDDQRLD
ncbi:hypothetical protein GF354_01215, partial [Candidatus Peregrinibacteria bacterium]|nr:hypothetical protein [Candidatus Peregrinibacteria bacterium]